MVSQQRRLVEQVELEVPEGVLLVAAGGRGRA